MKEIEVESYEVPSSGRSKNYRGKVVSASGGGGGTSSGGGTTASGGNADTAKVAQNLADGSSDWDKILRKDEEDSTNYPVDFVNGLKIASQLLKTVITTLTANTATASDDSLYTSAGVNARLTTEIDKLANAYLSKTKDDTAAGLITFAKGLLIGIRHYRLYR